MPTTSSSVATMSAKPPANAASYIVPNHQIPTSSSDDDENEQSAAVSSPRPAKMRKLSTFAGPQPFYRPRLKPIAANSSAVAPNSDRVPSLAVYEKNVKQMADMLETESRKIVEEESSVSYSREGLMGTEEARAEFYGRFASIVEKNIDALKTLRTHHPVLARYKRIYFDAANRIWVLDLRSIRPSLKDAGKVEFPLEIAGCGVHLHCANLEVEGTLPDPFPRVNPREFIPDGLLKAAAQYFPLAVGLRVLIWGSVEVLFENKKKIREQKKFRLPAALFGLTYSLVVLSAAPTSNFLTLGMQVARNADEVINVYGCVGLRIRRPQDNFDCWTTTTHAWVPLGRVQEDSRIRHFVKNVAASMIETLKGFGYGSAWGRRTGKHSPLGTKVFVADSTREIGTITSCYDDLIYAGTLPFPYGYQHDLSLITKEPNGDDMPTLRDAPNLPKIDGNFASPHAILRATKVFIAKYPVYWNKREEISTGHLVKGEARRALVAGAEYHWQRSSVFNVANSIIWRTEVDDESVRGASGTALFLGEPSATNCQAACFQNFEHRIKQNKFWMLDGIRNELTGCAQATKFKGGFLLPPDIQQSVIVVESAEDRRRSVSGQNPQDPVPFSEDVDRGKRGMSDPL